MAAEVNWNRFGQSVEGSTVAPDSLSSEAKINLITRNLQVLSTQVSLFLFFVYVSFFFLNSN
jgi:hypothetical protein